MITYVKGDLLETNCDFICHQVNCQGVMNSGIAKQIREKWPIVYKNYKLEYKNLKQSISNIFKDCDIKPDISIVLLGDIQVVPLWTNYYNATSHQAVINMFSQRFYGYDGNRYTSYDAFETCLKKIKEIVPKDKTIAFPYKIGCDRGGANWEIIKKMIEENLGTKYNIYIYERE